MMEALLIDEVSWRMNTQACVNVYIHIRVLTCCSDGGIIDRRGVMENEHTGMCHIHIRVKRVLTGCSDGGIIDRRGVMENEHTGMCQCIHTHKSKESTYSTVVMEALLIDEVS